MLLNGQKVGQDLRGVEFVGQAVEYRHARTARQLFHHLLAEAAVFDAVVHPAQDPGRIRDGLLFPDLGAGGVEVGHAHPQIPGSHFEGAAGAGGRLFKNQGHVFSLTEPVGNTSLLFGLEIGGHVQEFLDLRRRKIQQLEKMLVVHGVLPSVSSSARVRAIWARTISGAGPPGTIRPFRQFIRSMAW